jgi:pyruvate kinase
MRQTKIVATVGPASASASTLRELIDAGVDVFRLNFSHGEKETHASVIEAIRSASADVRRPVSVLQDLSGPKIRTGRLAEGKPLMLREGESLCVATGDFEGMPGRVSTTYGELARAVSPGDRLLLDDGRLELTVEGTDGTEIRTRVTSGGPLGERKGINAPGVRLPVSSLTDKDVLDLQFGLDRGVDMVALSFVRSAEDLHRARDVMTRSGAAGVPLIAKIERPEAIERMESVLDAADGIMVARGDLGLEIPLARVPVVQKALTRGARARGIPVIVATQVFDSMRVEPRPTRAEVSDAANAVHDGVDAIMLSGETAIGVNPVRVVHTLDLVIREAETMESGLAVDVSASVIDIAHSRALCEAAMTLARAGHADALVAVTRGGRTARVLSAFRPRVPIFAACPSAAVARRLALYRGVVPLHIGFEESTAETARAIMRTLVAAGALADRRVVVFVSVSAELTRRDSNFLRLFRIDSRHL